MEIEKIGLVYVVHGGKDEGYKEYGRFNTQEEAEDFVGGKTTDPEIVDYLSAIVSDTASILSVLEEKETKDDKILEEIESIKSQINTIEGLLNKLLRKK